MPIRNADIAKIFNQMADLIEIRAGVEKVAREKEMTGERHGFHCIRSGQLPEKSRAVHSVERIWGYTMTSIRPKSPQRI